MMEYEINFEFNIVFKAENKCKAYKKASKQRSHILDHVCPSPEASITIFNNSMNVQLPTMLLLMSKPTSVFYIITQYWVTAMIVLFTAIYPSHAML